MPRAVPAPAVLAIHVDDEMIRAVLVDRDGTEHRRANLATPVAQGAAAVVEAITTTAAKLASGRNTRLVGAAVVVPGIVDAVAGIARHSGQIGWHNVPLAHLVGEILNVPVALDHDVRAAAIAEGEGGAGRGARNWLYVSLNATIEAAAIVNGEPQRGATGAAGEFGHLPIYPFGEVCTCGQRGCVEAYAGTRAIETRFARVSGRTVSVRGIAELVGRDPLADEVWGHAAAAIGVALGSYTMIADPEVIVIAGELARTDDIAISSLRSELRARLAWREAPRIAAATVNGAAALIGAISLAWTAADSATTAGS